MRGKEGGGEGQEEEGGVGRREKEWRVYLHAGYASLRACVLRLAVALAHLAHQHLVYLFLFLSLPFFPLFKKKKGFLKKINWHKFLIQLLRICSISAAKFSLLLTYLINLSFFIKIFFRKMSKYQDDKRKSHKIVRILWQLKQHNDPLNSHFQY